MNNIEESSNLKSIVIITIKLLGKDSTYIICEEGLSIGNMLVHGGYDTEENRSLVFLCDGKKVCDPYKIIYVDTIFHVVVTFCAGSFARRESIQILLLFFKRNQEFPINWNDEEPLNYGPIGVYSDDSLKSGGPLPVYNLTKDQENTHGNMVVLKINSVSRCYNKYGLFLYFKKSYPTFKDPITQVDIPYSKVVNILQSNGYYEVIEI